jgi:uncharacterized membrane protein (DUF373 family)
VTTTERPRRWIIVADLFQAAPASALALATLMLALGVTYWLMRERDDRMLNTSTGD